MRWWGKRSELDAEIEAHIRMAVEERVARGEDCIDGSMQSGA
jgi:hypothetical protein